MTAVLLDLMGYEIHTYRVTGADWKWVDDKRRWPPLLLWGDRAFVRTDRYLDEARLYHEIRSVVIGDTAESGSRKFKHPI